MRAGGTILVIAVCCSRWRGRLVSLCWSCGPGRAHTIRLLRRVGNGRSGCCTSRHGAVGLGSAAAGGAMTSHLTFTEITGERPAL
jgi:hypothetical protein